MSLFTVGGLEKRTVMSRMPLTVTKGYEHKTFEKVSFPIIHCWALLRGPAISLHFKTSTQSLLQWEIDRCYRASCEGQTLLT